MNWQFRLAQAYRVIFLQAGDKPVPAGSWWQRLLAHARPVFGPATPPGAIVLADLAYFCCASRMTTQTTDGNAVDPIATARMEGRREVWLRINEALHLDDAVILNLREDTSQ